MGWNCEEGEVVLCYSTVNLRGVFLWGEFSSAPLHQTAISPDFRLPVNPKKLNPGFFLFFLGSITVCMWATVWQMEIFHNIFRSKIKNIYIVSCNSSSKFFTLHNNSVSLYIYTLSLGAAESSRLCWWSKRKNKGWTRLCKVDLDGRAHYTKSMVNHCLKTLIEHLCPCDIANHQLISLRRSHLHNDCLWLFQHCQFVFLLLVAGKHFSPRTITNNHNWWAIRRKLSDK